MEERTGQQRLSLNRLELVGFKSFCDKTELIFSPGITGIVGPNGCGKSNVSDCIAWVLGEQSAKSLRGEKMEDIIFSGTEKRGPLGMAQVALTLKTGLTDQKELVVGRRLFRDGESQYFLNGSPCRLRDIQDVIFDTGMGTKSYFLIEQGRIGQILQAKPTDRRLLIEEAAGISKYRAKKHAAELKLESSRLNLERVRDIIDEVRKQMGSLKRQAALARRYERLAKDARRLHKLLLTRQLRALTSEMTEAEEAFNRTRDREIALATRLSTSELEGERADIEAVETEKNFEKLRELVFTVQLAIQKDEAEIARAKEQRENLRLLIEQNQRRVAGLLEKEERLQTMLATLEAQVQEIERDIRISEDALQSAVETQRRADDALQGLTEQSRALRTRQREASLRAAAANNELIEITGERSKLEAVENRLHQEQDRLHTKISEIDARVSQISHELAAAEEALDILSASVQELAETEGFDSERLAETETRLADLERRRTATASRLQAIQAIESGRALVPANVRAILTRHAEQVSTPGICSDFIEVTDLSLVWAVENCLRAVLSGVVLHSAEDALRTIDSIKEVGSVTYLPVDLLKAESAGNPHPSCSPLADFIRIDERYPQLAALLQNIYVTETLEEAIQLRSSSTTRAIYAIRKDGSCLLSSGAIIAGSPGQNEESILWIKAEAKRLSNELSMLETESAPIAEEVTAIRGQLEQMRSRLRDGRTRIADRERAILLERQRHTQMTSEMKDSEEHLATIGIEIEHASRERRLAAERQAQLEEHGSIIEQEMEKLAVEIEDADRRMSADQEARALLRENVMRCESTRNTLIEKRRIALNERDRIQAETRDHRDERDACSNEMQMQGMQAQELDERRVGLEEQIVIRIRDLQENEITMRDREQALTAIREATAKRHEAIKVLRTEHQQAMETRSRAELVKAEKGRDLAHLRQTCMEEFHQTPEEVAAESEQAQAAGKNPASEAGIQEEADIPTIAAELERKKAELEKMGAINLRAMEDYDQAQERHEFLTAQEKDLLTSIDATLAAIKQMDEESRELFKDAFERINSNFGEVFRVLFGGGHAEMKLMEDEDVLEAGIEISAQPPGKKLHMLLALSGGEKALTAIALLFAIFQYKPSPFCLMDEVDAPLDETNTDRFIKLLEAYSVRTQFILITHNVKTMQAASTLYGITMQERGVSKVVSVKLAEAVAV